MGRGRGGIIPASAGSTRCGSRSRRLRWDHPRVCGEHHDGHGRRKPRGGSSPRLRGARALHGARDMGDRIIPASAGSTTVDGARLAVGRDHPRVCGEHLPCGDMTMPLAGSSPRLRGAQGEGAQAAQPSGIIPASAGSTLSASARAAPARDHPRVCGEHTRRSGPSSSTSGSSPRLRGAHTAHGAFPPVGGIIPASAGSTNYHSSSDGKLQDHPRVCGEHPAK